VIDKLIGRHRLHRQRMRVVPDASKSRKLIDAIKKPSGSVGGRNALSFVDTLAFDGKLSVANVRIETGCTTHQIRVHLHDRTTPIYGDDVYGFKDFNNRLLKSHGIARPLLHAFRLELNHPITNEPMVIQAPMAEDMQKITTTIWPEAENERAEFFHAS
jgi:23S rRNA-/tRNA-specific pseudouridylate synthase